MSAMSQFALNEQDRLHYRLLPPTDNRATFVFFNALTGETAMWAETIVPQLQAQGFGALLFNYRGQKDSPIGDDVAITAEQITADSKALLEYLQIQNLVSVGLSIGGYFAIRAQLAGCAFAGHVLLNTLRVDGPRLEWINAATVRAVMTGGAALLRDLYSPLLFSEGWQRQNRQNFLADTPYRSQSASDIDVRLIAAGGTADWNIPWEAIGQPVEVVAGVQDRLFRDPIVIDELLSRMPNARAVELDDCGHMIPVERPDAVVAACERIAERLS